MPRSECKTERRPVLRALDKATNTFYIYQPRCKMWKCPYCAQVNKQTWCATISEGIKTYQERGVDKWTFVTVTSSGKLKTMGQTLYVWPDAWAKLSRRIRYHFKGIRYVLLPEVHADGRMHIHAIASHGLGTRWLKDHACACGLGYMALSEKLSDHTRSVYYVTKYLNKAIEDTKWPSGFRRVRTSQHWPELPPSQEFQKLDLEWSYWLTYWSEGVEYLAAELREETGHQVKIL